MAASEPTIGIIGTGHFSSYLIAALRNGGHKGKILLSPYSRAKADALAEAHHCSITDSNAQLVAISDWILVSVRPEQLEETFKNLKVPVGKQIISAVAGVKAADLRRCVGTEAEIVRIIPAGYIEIIPDGIVPIFPPNAAVQKVLETAGTVVPFAQEEHFDLSMAGSCMSGWMYRLMDSLQSWFLDRGYSPEQARLVVADNIMGAAAYAKANPGRSLMEISDGIATEGTYTKAGLDHLLKTQASVPWHQALDVVNARLKEQSR